MTMQMSHESVALDIKKLHLASSLVQSLCNVPLGPRINRSSSGVFTGSEWAC